MGCSSTSSHRRHWKRRAGGQPVRSCSSRTRTRTPHGVSPATPGVRPAHAAASWRPAPAGSPPSCARARPTVATPPPCAARWRSVAEGPARCAAAPALPRAAIIAGARPGERTRSLSSAPPPPHLPFRLTHLLPRPFLASVAALSRRGGGSTLQGRTGRGWAGDTPPRCVRARARACVRERARPFVMCASCVCARTRDRAPDSFPRRRHDESRPNRPQSHVHDPTGRSHAPQSRRVTTPQAAATCS